jgi:lysozyme family protein
MMRKNFQQVTNWLLIHEGGFVNNPNDPGGATNKGITQRVYDGYRRKKSLPLQSVALMSDVECWEIYEEQYWNPIIGDELPSGLDYALYDFAHGNILAEDGLLEFKVIFLELNLILIMVS